MDHPSAESVLLTQVEKELFLDSSESLIVITVGLLKLGDVIPVLVGAGLEDRLSGVVSLSQLSKRTIVFCLGSSSMYHNGGGGGS